MQVQVELLCSPGARPPAGSPVCVQLRDTSMADAPAKVLAEARTSVVAGTGAAVATAVLNIDPVRRGVTVWAHVDVDRDDKVSVGDYITMASFPVPQTVVGPITVEVKRV